MTENNLTALGLFGQSIWLDTLSRELIDSGELERLVKAGVTGVTTNPAIFEKAVSAGTVYDKIIRAPVKAGETAEDVYRRLALKDVADAADILYPVYRDSNGVDGFVSLEVSPHLAHHAGATVDEARALWTALGRENVMIKVPGTMEALPAVSQLIAEGINVNVTLLFGLDRYHAVCEAWLEGLEARHKDGEKINRTASVASFFLSRIDSLADPMLAKSPAPEAQACEGRIAIACARLAYRHYRSVITQERFRDLETGQGARPQRLLWASTSTKNPAYSDVHYVEPLIGPGTVNTMPPATLEAFLDHGAVASTLLQDVDKAEALVHNLTEWGIDLGEVTRQLEQEGIRKFVEPYDRLLRSIDQKMGSPGK